MRVPILSRTCAGMCVVAAVVAVAATTACDKGGGGDGASGRTMEVDGKPVPVARLEDAAVALCTARDQARGDVMKASTTFYDRSHDALHTIASALEPVDRALAARLLEDKQRVEADLAAPPGTITELAAHLDKLAQVTRTGLAALSIMVPPCP